MRAGGSGGRVVPVRLSVPVPRILISAGGPISTGCQDEVADHGELAVVQAVHGAGEQEPVVFVLHVAECAVVVDRSTRAGRDAAGRRQVGRRERPERLEVDRVAVGIEDAGPLVELNDDAVGEGTGETVARPAQCPRVLFRLAGQPRGFARRPAQQRHRGRPGQRAEHEALFVDLLRDVAMQARQPLRHPSLADGHEHHRPELVLAVAGLVDVDRLLGVHVDLDHQVAAGLYLE